MRWKNLSFKAAYDASRRKLPASKTCGPQQSPCGKYQYMAMSRQKKLDKNEILSCKSETKAIFKLQSLLAPGRFILKWGFADWVRPTTDANLLIWPLSAIRKLAIIGANRIGKTKAAQSLLGIIRLSQVKSGTQGTIWEGWAISSRKWRRQSSDTAGSSLECLSGSKSRQKFELLWQMWLDFQAYRIRFRFFQVASRPRSPLPSHEPRKIMFWFCEPTNHLDVDAKEVLQRSSEEYAGAVSSWSCHEPEFLWRLDGSNLGFQSTQLKSYWGLVLAQRLGGLT